MTKPAAYWIDHLALRPHPEGGHFRETYRSEETIPRNGLPSRFSGPRAFATAIYFLLQSGERSALHRIRSDEAWHFYAGAPLTLHILHPDGRRETRALGPDPDAGQTFQTCVPAGCWFGATVNEPGSCALVGCTVAPGFDFEDFELADRGALLESYPQHRDLIEQLAPA